MSGDKMLHSAKLVGVYAILSTSGDGAYVGSSNDIDRRIRTHFNRLISGKHHSIALQNEWNSGAFFDVVVLQLTTQEKQVEAEQFWMDRIGPLLNTSKRADSPSLDPLIAKKIGDSNRGKLLPSVSESNRRRTGMPWIPRNRDAWRAKISASRTGKKYGPRSPEVGR